MTRREEPPAEQVAELRDQLHHLVHDVEPRSDALPRLLAATRRRRAPHRPLIATVAVAVSATAVLLVALLVSPVLKPHEAEPVSVQPNSYVAESPSGVLSSFDVVSGRRLDEIAKVPGPVSSPLAADGDRVYAAVPTGSGSDIVEVRPHRPPRRVATAEDRPALLTAAAGRVAYLDRNAVVIVTGGRQDRIAVPPGRTVVDLAADPGGRIAVLTAGSGESQVRVVRPNATTLDDQPLIRSAADCGPLAVTWTEGRVAALQPVDCGATRTRVATLDPNTGSQLGAGAPIDTGSLRAEAVQLSADRLGRFLVSASGQRQWLVDGGDVRTVPAACPATGACASAPATFWG